MESTDEEEFQEKKNDKRTEKETGPAVLEITVFAPVLHSGDRPHTAVYFVLSSLIQLERPRALITACKNASHHTYAGSCRNSLRHYMRWIW